MTWQPNYERAERTTGYRLSATDMVRVVLEASGALAEIDRLTALLEASEQATRTLNAENHQLLEDTYDSGYRAVAA